MTDKQFKNKIWDYYRKHGRNLPWRKTKDPYKILVSEVMLQQTQVERVIPKYKAFIKKFPTTHTLARAPLASVLKLWSGLGYNRRALYLKRTAETVVSEHKGIFPKTKSELENLPGIGPYTAGAIMAFAHNNPEIFIETNIRTVYIHLFFSQKKKVSDRDLLLIIERTLDHHNPRQWYAALMDYGSMLKAITPNPSRKSIHYSKQSRFEGSVRQERGRILKVLLEKDSVSEKKLRNNDAKIQFTQAIGGLIKDGLIKKKKSSYSLR